MATTREHCGHCHACGTALRSVLDGEEWCPRCGRYRRYRSHGWWAEPGEESGTPCPAEPAEEDEPAQLDRIAPGNVARPAAGYEKDTMNDKRDAKLMNFLLTGAVFLGALAVVEAHGPDFTAKVAAVVVWIAFVIWGVSFFTLIDTE